LTLIRSLIEWDHETDRMDRSKGKHMTDLEIKKANLRAARLSMGLTDDLVRMPAKRVQMPDGSNESDYRFRKFGRHHNLRAA